MKRQPSSEHPITRDELISEYKSRSQTNDDIKQLELLEPSLCAYIRDKKCFEVSSFPSLISPKSAYIDLGYFRLIWVALDREQDLLKCVDLESFSVLAPCQKRIKYIEKKTESLKDVFEEEIKLIGNFTSSICWIKALNSDQYIGSAGYYEVPHCTFFSDAAMFSIPPDTIVPEKHSGFAILENLYHEALHHQLHSYSIFKTTQYLVNDSNILPEISFSWRDRKFSLLEALHALHVYAAVTHMRLKYLSLLQNKEQRDCSYETEWLDLSIKEGMKMWKGLSSELLKRQHLFAEEWQVLIQNWSHTGIDDTSIKASIGGNHEKY